MTNPEQKQETVTLHDTQPPLLKDEEQLIWKIKTIASSPKKIMAAQLWLIAAGTIMNALITLISWRNLPQYNAGLFSAYIISYTMIFYFILIVRQKTVFKYCTTSKSGTIEYFTYYPEFASTLFKTISILALVFFFGIAIYSGSLLFLIGPVAMALGATKFLLGWKNEIKHEKSLPWNEYNFVTIDRKRLMVITHRTDLTLGFEARFPDEELLEKYLKILHSALPTTAEFSEKRWEW